MYSNPAVVDSQENGLAYICKCVAPYAGHNCEGTPPRNSNPKPYLEMAPQLIELEINYLTCGLFS